MSSQLFAISLVAFAFLCAFAGAVLSTLPIGPVNLLSLYFTLNNKQRLWRSFIGGILLADSMICVLALRILSAHAESLLSVYKPFVSHVGLFLSLLLFALGLRLVLGLGGKEESQQRRKDETCRDRLAVLSGGWLATALSPGLFLFWSAWWMKWIHDFSRPELSTGLLSIFVVLGVCLGDLLVFGVYRQLALRFGSTLIQRSRLRRLNQGIGGILIAAAIYIGWSF